MIILEINPSQLAGLKLITCGWDEISHPITASGARPVYFLADGEGQHTARVYNFEDYLLVVGRWFYLPNKTIQKALPVAVANNISEAMEDMEGKDATPQELYDYLEMRLTNFLYFDKGETK